MKFFIIITGLLSLIVACNSSTTPRDHQSLDKEEEMSPHDATETNSYSKDEGVPAVVP